ncbi:outer membrane beta-barrel family protein [uncultured Pedobacter sp.]|uniref:outer membrane beta-barrel family protein n=1 Tax=uncultured Pedobacter sp. TaxID=246139 RepID=UPI0025DF6B40|nr:outer membrane beta-barrel family protein [uncultured Pedobacter sp.]
MRRFLVLIFIFSAVFCYGQASISLVGKVADSSTKHFIPLVSVSFSAVGFDVKKSTLTDTSGYFTFEVSPRYDYILTISCIGYEQKTITVHKDWLKSTKTFNLDTIYLPRKSKKLDEVIVTGNRPKIRQEIDRLIYDIQADKDHKVLNVLEMMSKVPLLSLDGEENVLLKGSGSYRIFINGRPSAMFVNNPKEALRAMPASSVKQIEVITTPPAKYDAEGLAGIINIVLNKKLVDGYSASIGINYNNTVGTGENLTLSGKKGKFGITGRAYLFQDFERHLQKSVWRQTFSPYQSSFSQSGDYSFKGSYFTESVELSYDIDTLNLLTASINFTNTRYDDQTLISALSLNDQQQLFQSYQARNLNPQRESGLNLDVNYQKGFKNKKDRLLTLSYQYQHAPERQTNDVYFTNKQNYTMSDYWQKNQASLTEQTFQADYVHPVSKFTFEGGGKAIFRNNTSDFTTGLLAPINGSTNSYLQPDDEFTYSQNIFSLYQSWRFKIKSIELKTGLRLEHTIVNGDFVTQQQSLNTSYTNLIPVISIQHRLKQGALNFGFTQRINRPGIGQLNPFVNRANPAFASSGNPDLKAVLKNNLELSYSRYGKANINISSSYSFSNNTIQTVTTLVDSIAYTSFENLGKDRGLSLNLSVSYPFTKALSVTLNSELNYVWLKGTYNNYSFTNSGLQGYAYGNVSYDFKENWRFSLASTLRGRDIFLQGSSNGYIASTFRVSRNLFQKKFTVAATANNPFSKYRYVLAKTNGIDFIQERNTQRFYRSFSLSLNYNINNLKSSIRKNDRGIKNDDLISN